MGVSKHFEIAKVALKRARAMTYAERTPGSKGLFERAREVFPGGVSHNARYFAPYPLSVSRALGQRIWDEDGNAYVDYWMGHMALILGHSPKVVVGALRRQVGRGTHYGMPSRLSLELGEEVQRSVPCAEMLRFCNSGAEATMYLVRLARGYTGRKVVIKMAGGWHGYNTELNMGVHRPFDRSESIGILPEEQASVRAVRFNDFEAAEKAVRAARGELAAIFLEPVLGAGGCIPADRGFMKGLRELAEGAGALLAFDEIITGYRVALGGAQERYGVTPDLAALGKVVGGGLPIGLVCGREEVMRLADPTMKGGFVSIGGGTFSENPLTMSAGLATVRYLRKNRGKAYPALEEAGKRLREGVDGALASEGVEAHTTGMGSLFQTHFGAEPRCAEDVSEEDKAAEVRYSLFLMERGIFILPGHPGSISTAHSGRDLQGLVKKSGEFGSAKSAGLQNGKAKVSR